MDWLGGGDAMVRNAFLRASDDDLPMEGNWDGYTDADMVRPGHDVENILVENSELSTSISNIVRTGWPQKIFNSRNFTLRDSDILHAGIGACGQTFGASRHLGRERRQGRPLRHHTLKISFSTTGIRWCRSSRSSQPCTDSSSATSGRSISRRLPTSTITGDVADVTFDNVKYGQTRVPIRCRSCR